MPTLDLQIGQVIVCYVDIDASLGFYRDALGFDVRSTWESAGGRCVVLGPVDQPDVAVVLRPVNRAATDFELTGTELCLSTRDVFATFERLEAHPCVEVIREPMLCSSIGECPRLECAFMDPAGNIIRVVERL